MLANVALSVLDEHYRAAWGSDNQRRQRRKHGLPNWRLVRYADDFVVLVHGERAPAEALRSEVAGVLAQIGLRLSDAKTRVVSFEDGFDFLGWRIQRHRKKGADRSYVYTYPSAKALASVVGKIRAATHKNAYRQLSTLLIRVNQILRGWAFYFRHGVSFSVFSYLRAFTWRRIAYWIKKLHKGLSWKKLLRRAFTGTTKREITAAGVTLFDPASIPIRRYRYRGAKIPNPWAAHIA
ncbi:RNA-directed DNA polymerase [Amycolatopsis rubida]|uniref:RNA-directed DNA polymerase n=1 Tax=Amycolatopsis rubida TaxID=112413 RepID=A0ABX0BQK3_9PSEU|nr:RNA-directed DNA polymerase [Amycolatopsis rubida]NEC56669.1 RNA-directed DNA polymerase [Amycolatopsis rubida]